MKILARILLSTTADRPATRSYPKKWLLLGITGLTVLGAPPSTAQVIEKTGIIPGIISESSGVANSRAYPGVLWTHNDSGNRPTLYAIAPDGSVIATFAVPGARMRDWEDIAIGPCGRYAVNASGDCIYIADTGDNLEVRRTAQIYIVAEPNPRARGARETARAHRIDFAYEDGPVDVEGIAVDQEGMVWLVTKGRTWPIKLYSLDLRGASGRASDGLLRAVQADTLGLPRVRLAGWATGAAISATSGRLVVRTYVDIYVFQRDRDGRWMPAGPACHIGAIEPQGEAIDYLDEKTFVLTSESLFNRPGPIHRITCP